MNSTLGDQAMREAEPHNSNRPITGGPDDISNKLRVIYRRRRRLALAKQRQGSGCSFSGLMRVVLHVYRRMHRRVVNMFVRAFVGVNFVRVLHRRPDVVKPLD
jgi:hypothetical protein